MQVKMTGLFNAFIQTMTIYLTTLTAETECDSRVANNATASYLRGSKFDCSSTGCPPLQVAPQFSKRNTEILYQKRPWPLLLTSFQIHYSQPPHHSDYAFLGCDVIHMGAKVLVKICGFHLQGTVTWLRRLAMLKLSAIRTLKFTISFNSLQRTELINHCYINYSKVQ